MGFEFLFFDFVFDLLLFLPEERKKRENSISKNE